MENRTHNPWLSIWVQPKKTLHSILERNPKRIIIWLALIGGILSALSWYGYIWIRHPEQLHARNGIFLLSLLVGGAIVGLLHLYVGGWFYRLTGSWIGGVGSFIDVKCAVGWSNYPFILAQIFGFLNILSFPHPIAQSIFGILNALIAVWGIVIFLNLVGEAHRFSAWKALLACFIALVLVFVVIMIVSLLVPLLSPLFE